MFGSDLLVAQGYSVQSFRVNQNTSNGFVVTSAKALNNKGQIIGSLETFVNGISLNTGFLSTTADPLLINNFFQYIDGFSIQFYNTDAMAVNNSGVVIGSVLDQSEVENGFSVNPPYPILPSNYSRFSPPGSQLTYAYGINDSGQVVGWYLDSSGLGHGFLLSNGKYTNIDFPGAFLTRAYGINNNGQIVGTYSGPQGPFHGFILSAGQYTTIDFPGANDSFAYGINNLGVVVGSHAGITRSVLQPFDVPGDCFLWVSGSQAPTIRKVDLGAGGPACTSINDFGQLLGQFTTQLQTDPLFGSSFIATPGEFVDPVVRELIRGLSVIPATDANKELLATKGRLVLGIAADGASQLLLRIPTANVGDQITLTVMDDNNPPQPTTDTAAFGAVGVPGDASQDIINSQITVTALSTNEGPLAFAIYRAPRDFPRTANTGDPTADRRFASIQIGEPDGSAGPLMQIIIVRPPVILIHGNWGDQSTWIGFAGAVPNSQVFYVNYIDQLPPIASTIPPYPQDYLDKHRPAANTMGLLFNGPRVLEAIAFRINDFKTGTNPLGIPVAAIQADFVVHSLGGDILRWLPLVARFARKENLGQGFIHKAITLDTPHQGTPLATRLLQNENACVRGALAKANLPSFDSVTFVGGATFSGAIGDMQTGSQPLQDLANNAPHPFPIAFIAGTATPANFATLANFPLAKGVRCVCAGDTTVKSVCALFTRRDPLAQNMTPTGWPTIFNGLSSDAIVPESSQLNALTQVPAENLFLGRVHSFGVELMGFNGPSILDPGEVPTRVLQLLNTPISDGVFVLTNP